MERNSNIMKKFIKKYSIRICILVMSMFFLCTFIARKEGYHLDEILAYELANAEYNPWIVPTQPVGRLAKFMGEYIDADTITQTCANAAFIIEDTLKNRGSSILANYKADVYDAPIWMENTLFQDYVRCTPKDDFNLFSVYFNVKDDNHPPLHFMCLHLMCSLFKGEISVWHGCVINLVAMAGVLWILGRIGDLVFRKKSSVYALMILAGFSIGMTATTLWIRMYGLLTLWTVWLLYVHLRKYMQTEGDCFIRYHAKTNKAKWIGSFGIFWLTVLSFWTQYFGLFFILPLAGVTAIYLLSHKRNKEFWAYCRTMVTAGVVGVCVFPFVISDVFQSERGTEALSQWKNGLSEYGERLCKFFDILAQNVMGSSMVLAAAILIPTIAWIAYHKKIKTAKSICKDSFMLAMIPTVVYFLLAAKMSPYFVDRYIMAIFPITALLVVWLWDMLWHFMSVYTKTEKYMTIKRTSAIGVICAIVISLASQISIKGQHLYLYTGYQEQLAVAEQYKEYPLVCLYEGSGFYENVMEMEQYEQTILVKSAELVQMDESRTQVTKDGYVALIKYPSEHSGEKQLAQVMEVFGGTKAELLYEGGAFGDVIYVIY